MKRKTAALTAFLMCMAAAGPVCSAKTERYISISELSDLTDYMTGRIAEADSEKMDMNGDGTVNILDVILTKDHISNDSSNYRHIRPVSDYEKDIKDISKLNSMAETINETVVSVIAEKNSPDHLSGAIKSETVSYDDGSDISDEVNRILKEKYGYRNMVWYSDATGFSGRTVCSADGENIGSYPVIVPENIHIAPDQDYLSDMNSSSFSWENYFCSTTELNSKIKNMARGIDAAVAAAFRKEMISENDMTGEMIISSEDPDSEPGSWIKKYIGLYAGQTAGYKWTARLDDGAVTAMIISDVTGERTGAFPYAVPQSLDIPYSDMLLSYAAGEKNWKEDFGDCVSSDPQRAELPDISDMTEDEETVKAYMLFETLQSWFEKNADTLDTADGVYTLSDLKKAFSDIPYLKVCEYEFSYEHFYITIKDDTLLSVEYENDNSGRKTLMNEVIRNEIEENAEKHTVSSHSFGSVTVITNAQSNENGEYQPGPDHRLYYSTDAENDDVYRIICIRNENDKADDVTEKNIVSAEALSSDNRYIGGYAGK